MVPAVLVLYGAVLFVHPFFLLGRADPKAAGPVNAIIRLIGGVRGNLHVVRDPDAAWLLVVDGRQPAMSATSLQITLTVNGNARTSVVEPRMLLVNYLRDVLGLTGTHVACDTSQCGACTVMVDG